MFHFPGNQKPGFTNLNNILGSQSKAQDCPYLWDEDQLCLKNPHFDEASFRQAKLENFLQMPSPLTDLERSRVLDKVFDENRKLILEISNSEGDRRTDLEIDLDLLLERAFVKAEQQASLRVSRNNIQKTQNLNSSWMSFEELDRMMGLRQNRFYVTSHNRPVNRSHA